MSLVKPILMVTGLLLACTVSVASTDVFATVARVSSHAQLAQYLKFADDTTDANANGFDDKPVNSQGDDSSNNKFDDSPVNSKSDDSSDSDADSSSDDDSFETQT